MEGLFSSFSSISRSSTSSSQAVATVAELSGLLFKSQSTYDSSRSLAKAAVDWAGYCKLKTFPPDLKGKRYVWVASELGDDEFETLCALDAGLVLHKVSYCQQALSATLSQKVGESSKAISESDRQQLQDIKKMSSLINHDYLILELHSGVPSAGTIYIKAEKASAPKPGIHINAIPAVSITDVLHRGVKLLTVDCGNKPIGMTELLAVLKKEDPDYSLRNANCWDYALATTKHLLKRCVEVPGLSAQEKDRLLRVHDSLEANLSRKHIRNTVRNVMEGFGNLMSSSST